MGSKQGSAQTFIDHIEIKMIMIQTKKCEYDLRPCVRSLPKSSSFFSGFFRWPKNQTESDRNTLDPIFKNKVDSYFARYNFQIFTKFQIG